MRRWWPQSGLCVFFIVNAALAALIWIDTRPCLKNAKAMPQGVFSAEASLISPRKPSEFPWETALPGKKTAPIQPSANFQTRPNH